MTGAPFAFTSSPGLAPSVIPPNERSAGARAPVENGGSPVFRVAPEATAAAFAKRLSQVSMEYLSDHPDADPLVVRRGRNA
jgi:hypothetical protein